MKTQTVKLFLALSVLGLLANPLRAQKMIKKELFEQDSQTKRFLPFIYFSIPRSTDQYWLVSDNSMVLFRPSSGEILDRRSFDLRHQCVNDINGDYMLYIVDQNDRRIYGFDLNKGRLAVDLEVPELEVGDWIPKIEVVNCLKEGLELYVQTGEKPTFVFFKEYSDQKVSISAEPVIDVMEKVKMRQIIELQHHSKEKSRDFPFLI